MALTGRCMIYLATTGSRSNPAAAITQAGGRRLRRVGAISRQKSGGGNSSGSCAAAAAAQSTAARARQNNVHGGGTGGTGGTYGSIGSSSSGRESWPFSHGAAAAAVAAAAAAACVLQCLQQQERGEGVCLCKDKVTTTDSLQDYARRLQRLRSLRDIFDEYASVNADDIGKLMTCGDFLRAMLCYKYVRVDDREVKRRCQRYINPLLGDEHGLISFDEFCFLLNLLSIPAGLLDVAFAAADADGSGTIEAEELERLVERLAPPDNGRDGGGTDEVGVDGKGEEKGKRQLHKRLSAAWFGDEEDGRGDGDGVGGDGGGGGGGSDDSRENYSARGRGVSREQFAAFVRDLRLDVKTVECRLYSRSSRVEDEDDKKPAIASRRGWLAWMGLGGGRSGGPSAVRPGGGGGDGDGGSTAEATGGWWSRYEHDTISLADLALTLVSTCHPRDMPVFLTRVQAIQKKKKQIPLRDALLLHEVLEDHGRDLEDALGMYSRASSGGAVVDTDFARAAKVISGKEINPECVWVVFKMFDRESNGRLDHDEMIEATRERVRRLPGRRNSLDRFTRFVQCTRGGGDP